MMITEQTETPTLDQIMEEWRRLKYAAELLEQVYLHIGPYHGSINYTDEPWQKVRDFFEFDDSE